MIGSSESSVAMPGRLPRPSRRSGGLAVILVGALILCHGVFGFAHEISCHECAPTDLLAGFSPMSHGYGSHHPTGDGSAGGHAFTGYFGVVLALFGLALRGLQHGSWRRYGDASPPLHRPRPSPTLARPPRGPTLPLLQVFRL